MRLNERLEIRVTSEDRRELEVLSAARREPVSTIVRRLVREGVERELDNRPRRRLAETAHER